MFGSFSDFVILLQIKDSFRQVKDFVIRPKRPFSPRLRTPPPPLLKKINNGVNIGLTQDRKLIE